MIFADASALIAITFSAFSMRSGLSGAIEKRADTLALCACAQWQTMIPVKRNMGGRCTYASTKSNRVNLLFKGDDLNKIEIAPS